MNNVLFDYLDNFYTAYLDNILVYTNRTLDKHKQHIKKVLWKISEYKLLINLDKLEFYRT